MTHIPADVNEDTDKIKQARANACLIAAAPDMLAALRAAIPILCRDRTRQGVHAYQLASAAIAKTQGK